MAIGLIMWKENRIEEKIRPITTSKIILIRVFPLPEVGYLK
jgi:hypothetical protein